MARTHPPRVLPVLTLLLVAIVSACGADGVSAPGSTNLTKTAAPSKWATPPDASTSPNSTNSPRPTNSPTAKQTVNSPAPKPKAIDPAVACARREGNPGEIYVWNSYGSDQPPDAMRLGAGYVWDFGERTCITSTEFALTTNPGLPGFCTKVAKVSDNPGYRVDDVPAHRLKRIIGQSGQC